MSLARARLFPTLPCPCCEGKQGRDTPAHKKLHMATQKYKSKHKDFRHTHLRACERAAANAGAEGIGLVGVEALGAFTRLLLVARKVDRRRSACPDVPVPANGETTEFLVRRHYCRFSFITGKWTGERDRVHDATHDADS